MNTNPPLRTSRGLASGLAAIALCWPLLAAADCTTRKPRAAEADFNVRAMAAVAAALPPAPAGVQIVEGGAYDFKSAPAIYEVLCDSSKEGEFSIVARRKYLRKHTEAERKHWDNEYTALQTEAAALKKLPAEKTAQEQALRQQSNAAWQAMRDAEKAGDKATTQARDKEYRALRDQADGIQNAHNASVKLQLDGLNRRRTSIDLADQRVEVMVGMNLQRLPAANERQAAGSYGTASPGKSTGLKVHNVAWSAGGTDGTLRQALAGAIDRAHLQALVGKPLPAVAESEAFAAKAVPVSVSDLPGVPPSAAAVSTAPAAAAAPLSPAASPAPAQAQVAVTAPPPSPVSGPDTARKALDTVNQLRGPFGR